MTALAPLRGTVVIDEVQRQPALFPILRVLADRKPTRARFLVLGSAAPELLRQASESLAGRMETNSLSGFSLDEIGAASLDKHWRRGSFPRAFLARSESDSVAWRRGASFEGYAIEQTLHVTKPDEAYFWATHQGAELDLLLFKDGKRIGVEVKRQDAPTLSASMRIALHGKRRYNA